MRNGTLLLLGAIGVVFLAQRRTVGASGLTPNQFQQAVATEAVVPSSVAQGILNAPNAAAALQIGNDYLALPKSSAFAAVTTVQSLSSYNNATNPFDNTGGSYPRTSGGIYVTDPNMNERLRIAWDNSHAGFTH